MSKKEEKPDIERAYLSVSEHLLTELERANQRYMDAETLLIELLPLQNRIFIKKKILNHMKKYMKFSKDSG